MAVGGCALPFAQAPLAGRVWDTQAQAFISTDEAERRLAAADIALLGETHDNPVHHEIQQRIVERVAATGRRAALALEPLDSERQAAIDAALPRTAARIAEAASVSAGWSWPRYEALVDFAIERGWSLVAANLSRERTRPIASAGLASLGAGESARLALDRTDSPSRREALRAALVEGHCGDDSPAIDKLIDVQRARDAVIADRLLSADAQAVVAIVGRGHARRDVGVPLYLEARAPALRVLSLGMVEVSPGRDSPDGYPEAAPDRHHLVWFTPAAEREDPCRDFPAPK